MDATLKKTLEILEEDSRITAGQIAVMLGKDEPEIAKLIADEEKDGVILGYKTLIDWDKTDREYVTAFIQLKVTPQRGFGFDKVAQRIYAYPEVKTVYLCSGGCDLMLTLEGRTMKEVAFFVAEKLATLEYVTSTSTHFVLRKYKDKGVIYGSEEKDERSNVL